MSDVVRLAANHLDIWTVATERRGGGRGGGKRVGFYGVDRLRALILDLAVRGRLVPQDAADEPAGELLKRIDVERTKQIKAGHAKRMPAIAPSMDVPFDLPSSWAWTQLGAVTNYGQTEKADPGSVDDETWVLELEDVEKATSRLLNRVRHADRKFQSQKNRFFAGDVIYGKLRPYLDKVLIADDDGVCTTEMVPLRGYIGLNAAYIRIFLKTPFFVALADSSTHGMNLPRLGTEKARSAPFALPPFAEQRRIVAKVDELMGLCDALEREGADALVLHQMLVEHLLATLVDSPDATTLAAGWARLESRFDTLFATEASIDALKATMLEQAVGGKLVPDDQRDDWTTSELGKLIGPMDSGWSPTCHDFPARAEETWGVLKTTAVQHLDFQPEQNKELPEGLTPRPVAECRAGDILVTRAGPTNRVGICCFVPTTRARLMISDKIIRFRPKSGDIDGAYLALSLSVGPAADQIEKAKSGMAASQVNISQAKLRAVTIAIPPLAEQQRIVAKIEELTALCDQLKARIADAESTRRQLADAIVERAAG